MSNKKVWIILTLALLGAYLLVMFSWWIEGNHSDEAIREHCQQYKSIPEKHLDRVPDGCVPIYYENR